MRKVIIVVDMINDFVTGKFGSGRAQSIVPNIASLLEKARQKAIPIIYLVDTHSSSDPELEIWGEHAMKGSDGAEIIPGLKPKEGDVVLKKSWYSGFVDTKLPELLKELGVDTIIFTGVSTDICVQNNVSFAYFSGYKTVVPMDCTASIDEKSYELSLKYMKNIYGTEITTSDEVL
ncbi:MAG: cysteine hydrolase [Candidatus Methanoperedens sp.]|nr:cysteine hydrolase [Candidatus Methanoperedens sp.]PKL54303.1 MAG: nicotinamidase [Candidatus Methanoperedenaceae archaeon HGW-Methanoperedenaceae-1]